MTNSFYFWLSHKESLRIIIKVNYINMNFKCPFCPRTFSRYSAYSQHVQVCIKKVKFDSTEDNDNNISYSNVMDHDDEVLSEVFTMSYKESLRYAKESEDSNEFEKFEKSKELEVFEESEEPLKN